MRRPSDRPGGPWTHLALVSVGLLFLAAGCVSGAVSEEPTLQVDRPTDSEEECPEVDVLREHQGFAPRLFPVLDHGVSWPIELQAGEAIEIWIGHRKRGTSLPDLRVTDPTGTPLLEKDSWSSNDQHVAIEMYGTHEITVEDQYALTFVDCTVDIHWYPSIECALS